MSQQAIIVPTVHAPFEIDHHDIPEPTSGEVLIKIMTVALNPFDWMKRDRDFLVASYPAIMGHDIAGVVESIGEGVMGFKKGDRVYVFLIYGLSSRKVHWH